MKQLMKQTIILLLISSAFVVSCKRKQAVWDTDWQVPLIQDSLTLTNLVEDSILTVNAGYYELSVDRSVFELRLSDFIEIPDTTVNHSYALGLSSFNVQPGTSFVNDVQEHVVDMGEVQLKKIRVKEGGIDLIVKNPIATKTFFTVEIPGATKNGVTLSKDLTAPAGSLVTPSITSVFVDLTGYDVDLRGENMTSFNRIQTKMIVKTDPLGSAVMVTNQDSMRFEAKMENIRLEYARGYFGQELLSDTIVETIDALAAIESGLLDLDAADIGITVENGMKVNGKMKLISLKNINKAGNTVALLHPSIGDWITVNAATGTQAALNPSETVLSFNASNSNIEQFLENHGHLNEIAYQLQLNPWGNVSGGWDEIFDEHPLNVQLTANMPMNIGMTDLIVQDTFDFSLNQNVEATHAKSGYIWLKCTNAFPLEADLILYLQDESGNTLTSIPATQVIASSVYGTLVNGVQQKESYVQLNLNETQLELLNSTKKMVVKVRLNTPNAANGTSTQQQIPADAFFGFKLGAKLVIENRI
jgi:hypothetical protein